MRDFHMSMAAALQTDEAQARALQAWAMEANPWAPVQRVSDGYIAQERLG
jgi:hypothetical protein